MDNEIRRKDRAIYDHKEMEDLLNRMPVGRLAMVTADGPYVLPVNYLYADGNIYFHSSPEGRKMDAFQQNPQVCFLVDEVGPQVTFDRGCGFSQIYQSVMCFGTSEWVKDEAEKREILVKLTRRFLPPDYPLKPFDAGAIKATAVIRIRVHRMTGKANRFDSGKETLKNRFVG
jgi:nitroimidazol reductase NimA-like FMN-containing flavoprotein (pyridoxamine 5'-phosphate oxidase superfamily)